MNRQNNQQSIKEKIIKDLIYINQRVPSVNEVKVYYRDYAEDIDVNPKEKGNSVVLEKLNDLHKFKFMNSESSANDINNYIDYNIRDFETLRNELLKLNVSLEDYFRSLTFNQSKQFETLRKLELEVNSELLMNSEKNDFIHSIVENFDDSKYFDFQKSTATLRSNGKLTLGLEKYGSKDFQNIKIDYYSMNKTGSVLESRDLFNIQNILREDGSFFEHICFTNSQDSLVDFVITVRFESSLGENIENLKLVCRPNEGNNRVKLKIYVTQDQINYEDIFDATSLDNGVNIVNINKQNVKELKIIMSKRGYDYKRFDRYGYAFNLDYIGMTTEIFNINKESVAYLGPYEIKDENGNAYDYSMATIKNGTCCIIPELSTIDFYLSKNNVDWYPAFFNNDGPEVVQFHQTSNVIHQKLIENDIHLLDNSFNETLKSLCGLVLKDDECLLNFIVSPELKQKINKRSLSLFRNIKTKGNTLSGWNFLPNGFIETNIKVNALEGKYIDFGYTNNLCFLNERNVSGRVFIPQGIHKFKTNQNISINSNYNIPNLVSFKRFDNAYPYNHRYLIEGYDYYYKFEGERVYSGVDKVFGNNCTNISEERFNASESNKDIFCFIENEKGLFIKLKKNLNDSSHLNEKIEIDYKTSNLNEVVNNKLYIKVILRSKNRRVSPKVDSIQVRVI